MQQVTKISSMEDCLLNSMNVFKNRNCTLRIPNTPSMSLCVDSIAAAHLIVRLPGAPNLTGAINHGQ